MRIAILGTRGIPNHYGGFEQFAEYFSEYLVTKGHDVYVYSSSYHPYQEKEYKGVHIIHKLDPENKIGKIGQFIYDFNCIWDSRNRDFDIILQLGYTSSSVWSKFFPKKSILITNMDGMEWKRSKYSKKVQRFLKYAEKWAVKSSDYLVADSIGIQDYLQKKYQKESIYIAYGAFPFNNPKIEFLKEYQVEPFAYSMLIARMEPENNIETILDGVATSEKKQPFLVIGNHEINGFGRKMKEKFKSISHIHFLGGFYNQEHLDNLRFYSNLYFHGHSVGGTNPSLLEAMGSHSLIVAHDNVFNKSILQDSAFYFSTPEDVKVFLDSKVKSNEKDKLNCNFDKINQKFNLELINGTYLSLFEKVFENRM